MAQKCLFIAISFYCNILCKNVLCDMGLRCEFPSKYLLDKEKGSYKKTSFFLIKNFYFHLARRPYFSNFSGQKICFLIHKLDEARREDYSITGVNLNQFGQKNVSKT